MKILHIVQKNWAPLRKLFAPPGVPSWLRAWLQLINLTNFMQLILLIFSFCSQIQPTAEEAFAGLKVIAQAIRFGRCA